MSWLSFLSPFFHKFSFWGFSAAAGDFERTVAKVKLLARHPLEQSVLGLSHICLSDRPRPFKAPEGLGAQCAFFFCSVFRWLGLERVLDENLWADQGMFLQEPLCVWTFALI